MKICEAGRSSGCCSNPNIRTINTMSADTVGNFTIRGEQGIHVRVGTNEIIISGIAVYYDNTDGNIVIDNDLMTVNLADDITITGDMIIAGDLTVNGTYYTVHAEHVYTQDDYIILREGATTPLASGSYAGFQVKKYDGTNDGRLVIDNSGVARVGDVGDEQPLLTRSESASLTNGNLLQWNGTNQKAVDAGVNTSQIVRGSGNIGSDIKPVKIVGGVATAITNPVAIAGNTSSFKWVITSGYTTIRVQNGQQHIVTVNCPNADGNRIFPILQNSYAGSDWSNMTFSVSSRNNNGFNIVSWINTTNAIDVNVDIFWMALVPQSL